MKQFSLKGSAAAQLALPQPDQVSVFLLFMLYKQHSAQTSGKTQENKAASPPTGRSHN